MTYRTRLLLLVTALVAVAIVATAAALSWTARQTLLAETEEDAVLIAHLLGRSAEFAEEVSRDAEGIIGDQMVVQATIAAHLVAVAEAAGLPPEQINLRLRQIADRTVLDEFWISDEKGHAYLRNVDVDFSFNPDPAVQPQAHVFWPLLTGAQQSVVQEARQREIDPQVFKYAGVGGVDKPRIVQVGYNAKLLADLGNTAGVGRLVDRLMAGGEALAIRVVDGSITTLAYSAVPGATVGDPLTALETDMLRLVVADGRTVSIHQGTLMTVIAPITRGAQASIVGATLVHLPTQHVDAALQRDLLFAGGIALVVLALGAVGSALLARHVTDPVTRLTAAAAAVEGGTFDTASLTSVSARTDELGQLGRVFARMAREVQAREARLRQQVQTLQIEIDEGKRARQVAEIAETDYFQQLQQRAKDMRSRSTDTPAD